MSGSFDCKQFSVIQTASKMKVNTDAVLLGAWANVEGKKRALDIGTGTGIIALMLAQRGQDLTAIDGIEIDKDSAEEAKLNFSNAPWSDKLTCIQQSIQEFSLSSNYKYNLIVSNPPFFTGGTFSKNENKSNVRHTIKLSHSDLLRSLRSLLSKDGEASLVLPYIEGERFIELANRGGLFLKRITEVRARENQPVERLLIALSFSEFNASRETLIMMKDSKERDYTDEYIELTKEFYTIF